MFYSPPGMQVNTQSGEATALSRRPGTRTIDIPRIRGVIPGETGAAMASHAAVSLNAQGPAIA
jgi:hypothetical protein